MKVAVIGSGAAGAAATWLLSEHSEHEVHVFDSANYAGGHANTISFSSPQGNSEKKVDVDSAFIYFNRIAYPNFSHFLDLKAIPSVPTEISFSVSRDRGLFEWGGRSIGAFFVQRRTLFYPDHWRLSWDILRFSSIVTHAVRQNVEETIGAYLSRNGYSDAFADNFLLPLTASIWAMPPNSRARDFPALTLFRYLHNHHLLQLTSWSGIEWLTIKGGSHQYLREIYSGVPRSRFHLSTPIVSVSSRPSEKPTGVAKHVVTIRTEDGRDLEFDEVIMATHADQTLKILKAGPQGATDKEKEVLGNFSFVNNDLVLHADTQLMPTRTAAWSAWNYVTHTEGNELNVDRASVTLDMNRIQHIPADVHGPVLLSMNPSFEPRKELIVGRWDYAHPIFNPQMLESQKRLPEVQGKRGLRFAGAWTGNGFHEDAFKSGMRAAASIDGVRLPFEIRDGDRALNGTFLERFARVFFAIVEPIRRYLLYPLLIPFVAIAFAINLFLWGLTSAARTLLKRASTQCEKGAWSYDACKALIAFDAALKDVRKSYQRCLRFWGSSNRDRGPMDAV